MALSILIQKGITSIMEESQSKEVPLSDSEKMIWETVRLLPTMTTWLNNVAWDENSTPISRSIFPVAMNYLLLLKDEVPYNPQDPLSGILDDVYFTCKCIEKVLEFDPQHTFPSIEHHQERIRIQLSPQVVQALDEKVELFVRETQRTLEIFS